MSAMYRAYQPILPAANLYLQDKWDRNRYEKHRKKVEMAVPAVDTKGTVKPTHLLVNMKKIQTNRELQGLIEKQNNIHSKKLSAIRQSHGQLDNWNFYPQRSLNVAQQRQQFNKISYDNGKILERILRRESEYGQWESEWEKVKRIQANISRYPQIPWVRGKRDSSQHRVTFMENKRNTDIQNLFEESEIDGTQSRTTSKLDCIPKRPPRHRKEPLNHIDNRKEPTQMQAEKRVTTLPGDKAANCFSEQGSAYRFCKKERVISAKSEKVNLKKRAESASDQKTISKYKNDRKYFSELTSGKMEQNNIQEDTDSCKEECISKKYEPSNEQERKVKNGTKTSMSHESSDQTFYSSQEESDTSSCYSFQGSEERPSSSSSQSSRMSETRSSVSINLKPRMTSSSSTIRSADTSHKLKTSKAQNNYRSHDASSQESSTSLKSIQRPQIPVTSFHRLEVFSQQNQFNNPDISLLESEKSDYDIAMSTNRYTESSERIANSSPESLVMYPQKWAI